MLPRILSMQAFGPYVEKQELDFSNFSSLFLIRGETGSGKTMILDAMTYALYGKSSGGQREDFESMRSRFAKDDIITKVSFTFSIREHTYRFDRSVEVKTKRNLEKTSKMKIDAGELINGVFMPFFENPKLRNIEEKAIELIGLTHEQFIQVMVLPQGKFEQLLTSKSEEKQDILRSLFQMERWVSMSTYLSEKANGMRKEMEQRKQKLDALWQSVEVAGLEELNAKLEALKAQEALDFQQVEEATKAYQELQQQLQVQVQLHQDHEKLKQLLIQETTMKKRESQIQALTIQVKEYQRYEKILPYYERKKEAEAELNQRNIAYTSACEQLRMVQLDALQIETWQQELLALEEKRQQVQQQITQWNTYKNVMEKRHQDEQKLHRYQQELIQKETTWKQQMELVHTLSESLDALMKEYLQNSAMQLRAQLENGVACPVCGSLHHPIHDVVQQQYGSVLNLQQKQEEVSLEKQKLEQVQLMYREQCARHNEFQEIMKKEQARFEAQCQQDGLHFPNMSIREIQQTIKELEATLQANGTLQKEKEVRVVKINSALQECLQREAFAKEEQTKAQRKLQEATTAYEQHAQEGDEEEKLNQLPSSKDMEQMNLQIETYQKQCLQLSTQKEEVQKRLKELPLLEVTVLSKQVKQLEEAVKVKQQELAHVISLKQLNERVKKQGEAMRREYEEKQPSYQKLVDFARAIRGDNSIGIERYVLGVMLSNITQTANQLLLQVHQGRYQLYRSEHASNKTRKFGLEFSIYDSYTCTMRSVVSLSGGEKFLVSLALSLALSNSVQARNGGIQFDCMFIDEGFGTLDDHSMVDALSILESMGKQKGKIGIISHVELLKENIVSGVEVHKTRTGSTISIRKD